MVKATNNLLGITRDGYEVYDREDSHFQDEGGLTAELLKEALSYMYAGVSMFKVKTVDFRRIVGIDPCVQITESDDVVMVYLKDNKGPIPMVKNRQAEPSSKATIILRKERRIKRHHTLITAYIGDERSRKPGSKYLKKGSEEFIRSTEFWKTHALIYNEKLIDHFA